MKDKPDCDVTRGFFGGMIEALCTCGGVNCVSVLAPVEVGRYLGLAEHGGSPPLWPFLAADGRIPDEGCMQRGRWQGAEAPLLSEST